jgi:transposase-like protein
MENAAGDLRRALGGPILGRQLLEVTRHAVDNLLNLTHTTEETLSFYRLPFGHHKHLKSTNMLERLNEEIKRRTQVVRIFPNEESCLRLIRALAVETHENWIEANRYLDMSLLTEMKKKALMELVA